MNRIYKFLSLNFPEVKPLLKLMGLLVFVACSAFALSIAFWVSRLPSPGQAPSRFVPKHSEAVDYNRVNCGVFFHVPTPTPTLTPTSTPPSLTCEDLSSSDYGISPGDTVTLTCRSNNDISYPVRYEFRFAERKRYCEKQCDCDNNGQPEEGCWQYYDTSGSQSYLSPNPVLSSESEATSRFTFPEGGIYGCGPAPCASCPTTTPRPRPPIEHMLVECRICDQVGQNCSNWQEAETSNNCPDCCGSIMGRTCSGGVNSCQDSCRKIIWDPPRSLDFSLKFQGAGEQAAARKVDVVLKQCGTTLATYEDVTMTVDGQGVYTGKVEDLHADYYDVYVKDSSHLQKKFAASLTVGSNTANWSSQPLLAGDCNVDNKVDLQDFVVLRNHFGSRMPDEGSPADFNNDGRVSVVDFAYIAANFNKSGD